MITTNFHTHCNLCDGSNTPEEMVKAAIDKGFTALGFSSHSYLEIENDYALTRETEKEYIKEINRLKEKYKRDIKIFCGIELEYYSPFPEYKYDYIIGSVHYVLKDGYYIPVDLTAQEVVDAVESLYNGNFSAYAEDFFKTECDVVNKTKPDIIGHIDLVSKFCEKVDFKITNRYLNAAQDCIKALVPYGIPFEINTGAISRGYRIDPYPSPEILKMINLYGGKIVISSDCHNKDFLDCAFDKAVNLAINCGFSEHGIITENGIEYIKF